jgi:hypothetical protein
LWNCCSGRRPARRPRSKSVTAMSKSKKRHEILIIHLSS